MRNVVLDQPFVTSWYQTIAVPGSTVTRTTQCRTKQSHRDDVEQTVPRPDGFRPPTGYYAFFGKCIPGVYDYTYQNGLRRSWGTSSTNQANVFGHGTTNVVPRTPVVSTNMRNQAKTEALLKLKSGNFNLAVSLAEARQTLSLVAMTMLRILKAYRFVKRLKYREALNVLKINPRRYASSAWRWLKGLRPADFWLEIQYGWKPLLGDIYALINALRTDWASSPPLCSVKRTLTYDYGQPAVMSALPSAEFKGAVVNGVQVKLFFRVDDPFLYMLSSLGLLNPFELIWETLPFSFVLDWFIPIGNFLSAITAFVGVEYHAGYETLFSNGKFEVKYCSLGTFDKGTKESLTVEHKCMLRTALIAIPTPKPYVDLGLSSTQITSAMALLVSTRVLT